MTQQKTNRGFTIVELLIVIVVIAILATITIIGFNGVQERARNTTAKETGSALLKKVESYKAVEGTYPVATSKAALLTEMEAIPEAELDTSLSDSIAADAASVAADETTVHYAPCASPNAGNGGTVTYWQSGGAETFTAGSCS